MKEYKTVEEAVADLKLDKRTKWFEWCGELVCNGKATLPCSGCDGGKCHECGYTGKRIQCFPSPVIIQGSPVKLAP